MRILITGAAGFIGSHLVRELDGHGHEVTALDRHHLRWPDGYEASGDWDLTAPEVAMSKVGDAEIVVHLAAQVGRMFGEQDPEHTIRSNALMTTRVAQAAAATGARLVYASTSEVYGDQGDQACREDEPLPPADGVHNLYGLSKRWGEEACRLYAPDGLQVLRFSMPYGPGVPPGRGRRALDTMLWQAHHRMPITVHQGATRSWCWIADVVAAVRLIIEHGDPGAYNVGRDDAETTMLEVACRACELTGAPYDLIDEIPAPARQTVVKRLPTAKIRALGWRPTVQLGEGMRRVYDWVRQFDADGQRVAA